MAMLFAASAPSASAALVALRHVRAQRRAPTTTRPPGRAEERAGRDAHDGRATGARRGFAARFAPSHADDAEPARVARARCSGWRSAPARRPRRRSSTAASTCATSCGTIRVPTLLLHRRDDAGHRRRATRATSPSTSPARGSSSSTGADSLPFLGDADAVLGEIERVPHRRPARRPSHDRVLATVLFTDIVGSTVRAAALGDEPWRDLLAEHDRVVRACLARHRGREIKSVGDGFLAMFDGPARAIRAARSIVSERHRRSGSRSAPACTPASSRWSATTSPASPSTSPRA